MVQYVGTDLDVSFAVLSDATRRGVLERLNVVAAAVGNFLNHREHAVQRLKQSLAGLPLRAATHAPLDPARAWS